MITYEMLIEDSLTDGVTAISLVDEPAIMSNFILLAKDNKIKIELGEYKLADKSRRVVTGAVLIPDLVIPRADRNIVFSKDTIRKISEKFLINGNQNNVTLQHKVSVAKVSLVESWIVENKKMDKSTALGLDVPTGTWMVSFKVQDEELWQEYLTSGVLRGFSVEAQFTEKEVNLHVEMSAEDKQIYELYKMVNYTALDVDSYYIWKLGSKDHCETCVSNNNKVMKLKEWANKGVPRLRTGDKIGLSGLIFNSPYTKQDGSPAYSSYCEDACDCTLDRVTNIKKPTIKNPFVK